MTGGSHLHLPPISSEETSFGSGAFFPLWQVGSLMGHLVWTKQASLWYHQGEPWCSLLTVGIQMTHPLGLGRPPTRRRMLMFGQAKA